MLGRIWKLSDIDKDGMLDIDEWALSQHLSKQSIESLVFFGRKIRIVFSLVKIKVDGHELPTVLPDHLIPPSKRHLVSGGSNGMYPAINQTSS